ncbi:MAG: ERAP1-like C-terminal domain-containing protein [Candidatus Xenobia bacterium]
MTVLKGRRGTLPVKDGKLNTNGIGYYRVLYSAPRLHRLTQSAMLLSPADRLNLLGDTWAQTKLGELPLRDMLALIQAVQADRKLATWEEVLADLDVLDDFARGTPQEAAWQAWCRHLLQPVFHDIGWDPQPDEPDTRSLLRARLVAALGRYNDPAVVAEARRRFAIGPLTGDLRDAVASVVGRHADTSSWNALRDRGRHSTSLEEQVVYYDALALARDPKLAQRSLDLSLTGEPSPVLAPLLVIRVAEVHPDMAYRFALQHRTALLSSLTVDQRQNYLPDLMETGFSDVQHARLLEAETTPSVPVRKAVARLKAAAAEKALLLPQLTKVLAAGYRSAPRSQ